MKWKDYIERNPGVLLSDKKVRALLGDVYLNDQLSINLMMNAYGIGIIAEMRERFPVDQFTITRWSKRLVTDYGVSDERARWAIETWIDAMSAKVLHDLTEAEKRALIDEEAEQRKREEEAILLAEEMRKRQEAEEAAREEARRNTPDSRLRTRDDYSSYYINPRCRNPMSISMSRAGSGGAITAS